MSPVARSRQAHAFSTEKKKKLQRIRKSNHHVAGREIKSVADTTMPDTAYTEQIKLNSKPNSTLNSKPNTERNTTNTERQRFLSKKKKIPKYTNKNQTPANPRSRRRDAAARSSSLAPHRRSEIGLCSGAPSGPPSRVFLSFSLSLYLTVTKMKNGTKSL